MHISEGVLSAPVLAAGAILTVAGTSIGLKRLDFDRIAGVAILASAFFAASLVHFSIGIGSVHLVLNGLLGLILGWAAFPAILVALLLHAVLFQFGGITTLGVNAVNMAFPAVICHYFFRRWIWKGRYVAMGAAFACGFLAIFITGLMLAASLIFSAPSFWQMASVVLTANLPVMFMEGIVTTFCIAFLKKVKPAMLPGYDKL